MTIELTGIVTDIFPIETYSGFKKRRFWIRQPTSEKYPQHWGLEVRTNQLNLLDSIKVDDEVMCTVNLLGKVAKNREGVKIVINTLQCWKLKKKGEEGTEKVAAPIPTKQPTDLDDLPF